MSRSCAELFLPTHSLDGMEMTCFHAQNENARYCLLVDVWLPWKPGKEGEAMGTVEAGNGGCSVMVLRLRAHN